MIKILLLTLLFSLTLAFPRSVVAHSFGETYTLPVPVWMYLYGGAAALVVSFLVIGYFISHKNTSFSYPKKDLSALINLPEQIGLRVQQGLKISVLLLLILTFVTGLLGSNSGSENFSMTFFWIFFILGVTYLTALFGDFYRHLNPFRILADTYENISGKKISGWVSYPKKLSYYPALLMYVVFIGFELFANSTPKSLATILGLYFMITIFGIFVFGKEVWLSSGEFFSVYFRLIGKLAPISASGKKLILRPPFVGLLASKAGDFSQVFFIMFMLSSTAYDGFRGTVIAYNTYYPAIHQAISPIFGDWSYRAYQIGSLLFAPVLFCGLYYLFIYISKSITHVKISVGELGLQFAYSLIPIALVYNLAHYYTLLLTEGQNLISLISDPFGWGWNIFGTANFRPNLAIINASVTWNVQVGLILLGHIAAVYIAHLVSLKIFPNHRLALLSQLPMLLLMVTYTLVGLWVLSLPRMVFGMG